jgi:proteasome lid subunit RPN8/RPN11
MTDTTPTVNYVAQLQLSLPGEPAPATITLILAPTDGVPVNGKVKPLADCTLAELRAFANTLEAEVWQTHQAITLHALHEEEGIDVRLVRLDPEGQAADEVTDWLEQAIVFPAKAARKPKPAADKAEPAPKPDGPHPEPVAPPQAALETPAPQVSPPPPAPITAKPVAPPPKVDLPASVRILETPVEAEEETPAPTIIRSEARVRVAGQRLRPGAPTWAAVDVLLDEPPLRAMQAHALSSLDREVAGVMVGGRPEKQPDGRYVVHIIDSIAAKYTVMNGASVTYTADSWRYLNDTMAERYPNETAVMVGWYHTHPGFGIFLSGMDLFIHQNFFTQVWHVAYVLDPRARTSGFFGWNREKTKVNRLDFAWPDWAADSW